MVKTRLIAAALAALIAAAPVVAQATQKEQEHQQQRDGQSRHESEYLNHVPLILSSEQSLRIARILLVTQTLTYLSLTSLGVDVVSQDRIGLGGLGVAGCSTRPTGPTTSGRRMTLARSSGPAMTSSSSR